MFNVKFWTKKHCLMKNFASLDTFSINYLHFVIKDVNIVHRCVR